MPETIPYLYTSQTEMESIFGAIAVELRTDDDEDSSLSVEEQAKLTDVIEEATDVANQYLAERYRVSDLNNSKWVRRRVSYIACYFLSIRQGNPEQYGTRYAQIIEEFEAVKDERMNIPRIPVAYDNTPALSNVVIDHNFVKAKIRTQTQTSTGGTDLVLPDINPMFGGQE